MIFSQEEGIGEDEDEGMGTEVERGEEEEMMI